MAASSLFSENFRDAPARWAASVYFTGAVIAALSGDISVVMLVLALGGLALFAPPLQFLTRQCWNFALKGWPLIPLFIVFVLLIGQVSAFNRASAERAVAEQQTKATAAAVQTERRNFIMNKTGILAQMADAVAKKQFAEAQALGNRYLKVTDDAQLKAGMAAARKAALLWSVDRASKAPLAEVAAAYAQLAQLEPENAQYRAASVKFAALRNIEAQEEAQARLAAEARAVRVAKLEKQFSPWDGSHPAVEAAVKRSMKNPDSYKHVETRYTLLDHGMRIRMVFRGTNSFGGVVPNSVVALVDDEGRLVTLGDD
jgi:hypothetical protein